MLFSDLQEHILKQYQDADVRCVMDCHIHSVELYESDKILPSVDSLCLFTATHLSQDINLPLNFVCVGALDHDAYSRVQYSNSNYILIPQSSAVDALYFIMNLFGDTLKQQKLYSTIIYMLLNGADLTSIFSEFSRGTGCPMLAIDATGKVLGNSKPFLVDHPHWSHSVEVGYLDDYLIEYILTYRVKHSLKLTPKPFVLYCDRLQMHIKVVRVLSNNEVIGYVFIGNHENSFPWFSDKLMMLLARNLHSILIGDRGYSTYRFNMRQNVLADIIDGFAESESAHRINAANLSFPQNMRCIVVKPSYFRGNEYIYDKLMPMLTAILPETPKVIKKYSIVAVLEADTHGELYAEAKEALESLAARNQLHIGISNLFHKPEQLATYYQQACQTLSFIKRMPVTSGLLFFSDYAFYIMLDSIEDKALLEQCRHNILPALEEYDLEKNTELYKTLRIYTQMGFSKNATAERMFLHRNTVGYRISQIESIFSVDFSNPTLLFRLQYSFGIDDLLKNSFDHIVSSLELPN